ncbi:MAG: bifunctional pyr operon transcriptional regulator/uracil phosphoribosyltransferase PyrR [Cocleimonas sp.]|nr:bifunctional pyr operon transcriptional regulator/uracil phosphoribosyltransferase PyrR [Cocleimonas sp.]
MSNYHYNIPEYLDQMASQLSQYLSDHQIEKPLMVGIHSAGVWLAQALHRKLDLEETLAELNTSFYRDDFNRIGLHGQIKPSKMPISVENKHIILVDDVLYTGRTIRAAMNELFDYGRPASITVVVLIDRGGRELPISAQVIGFHQQLPADSDFKLSDSEQLALSIIQKP